MVAISRDNLSLVRSAVGVPSYDPRQISTGIVHFGVGAFHRSHQAMYVNRLLNRGDHQNWGICGVGVLPSDSRIRDVLRKQDNLYTLVVTDPDGNSEASVIGSISEYLFAPGDPHTVIEKLVAPSTRIVSLTVTEGGYSVNSASGAFEPTDPDLLADLQPGAIPRTVFGYLAEALSIRKSRDIAPFTVVSCDNIQANGVVARTALVSFAKLRDAALGEWIDENVSFPNSMVDRITPATTPEAIEMVERKFGIEDRWPVVSETFEQWVLEDKFTLGRPDLASVGVQLVADVEPYEMVKLRLLNASHQAMSYLGLLAGFTHVHELAKDPLFREFLLAYMTDEASPTLRPVPGIDLREYQSGLLSRFSSEAIADTLARQVVDGSERIPKFLLPVVDDQLAVNGEIGCSVLVIAAWSIYLQGVDESGHPIAITDVREKQLKEAVLLEATQPGALLDVVDVFGRLGRNERLRSAYITARNELIANGSIGAMRALLRARSR